MPILSSGANATIAVTAGQILTVMAQNGSEFVFENPVGTRVADAACNTVYGPFSAAGNVKLTSVQGPLYYELAAPAAAFGDLGAFAWASLPAAASYAGYRARVSDYGVNLMVISDGVRWMPNGVQILGRSAVAQSVTGTTSETVLATVTIPAGLMGINGAIRLQTLWTNANNANVKTVRARLGGIGGSVYLQGGLASTTGAQAYIVVRNRNSAALQVGFAPGAFGVGSTTLSTPATSTIDTTVNQDVVFTAQLAVGTDTETLESYTVEVLA